MRLEQKLAKDPARFPELVLSLAVFFGAIVAWVTDQLPQRDWLTNVPCRRCPGRRRCRGEIVAELDRTSGHIVWHCPLCRDNGLIHGWEGPGKIARTHNALHQHVHYSRCFSASVPRVIARDCEFLPEFGRSDGLQNRRMERRNSWIEQVLISRTLSVCGEVAERLKAAVC